METVYDLFKTLLDPMEEFISRLDGEELETIEEQRKIPLASHVGEVSRLAITKTAELLSLLDSHSHVRFPILEGLAVHIGILING